jgi:hypothetical protein
MGSNSETEVFEFSDSLGETPHRAEWSRAGCLSAPVPRLFRPPALAEPLSLVSARGKARFCKAWHKPTRRSIERKHTADIVHHTDAEREYAYDRKSPPVPIPQMGLARRL